MCVLMVKSPVRDGLGEWDRWGWPGWADSVAKNNKLMTDTDVNECHG